MSMVKLREAKKNIRRVNVNSPEAVKPRMAEEKPKTFEEKYKRVTTYVEQSLFKKMDRICKDKLVRTKTDFVNEAFREYIENHFE